MAKITNKQKIEKYQEVITDMQGLINLLKAAAPSATRFERADFLYLDTKMLDIKRLVTGRQQK